MNDKVFLAACPDYKQANVDSAVRRVLDGLGGIDALNIRGKSVLLKVNLLSAFAPERAVTTHPSVAEALCREFIAAGASVTIADSPGGPYTRFSLERVYNTCGMSDVAKRTSASLGFDTGHGRVSGAKRTFNVINAALEADLIVSVAKLKTHGLAYYTGAVKNMFGVVPGLDKPALHSKLPNKREFCNALVDLCETVKPALSIVDGVWGMEGAGPSGGTPKFAGVIGGSLNPYALDAVMCDVACLPRSCVPVLVEADQRGLLGEITHAGDAPERFRTAFKPAIKTNGHTQLGFVANLILPKKVAVKIAERRSPYPIIQPECIGCGKCAESCPRSVITITDRRAVVNLDGCIRCYCCHEMCPVQAIELKKRNG